MIGGRGLRPSDICKNELYCGRKDIVGNEGTGGVRGRERDRE